MPCGILHFSFYPLGIYIRVLEILIQVDIGGHPPIPTGSSYQFLVHCVLLYLFVIVGSTLLGFSEAVHIFQVETGSFTPNPTGLVLNFSFQHIFLYF